MSYQSPRTPWLDHNGKPDDMRDGLWWYGCMPRGVVFCRDGLTVLINGPQKPLIEHDWVDGVRIPASCSLFERSWEEWKGLLPGEERKTDEREPLPYEVEAERSFYDLEIDPPWGTGFLAAETRLRLILIVCDFMEGKMPERRVKK